MSSSPYLVPVARLKREEPASVEVSFSAPFDEAGEFPPRAYGESDVPAGAVVGVDLVLASFSGGLSAVGELRSPWRGICRRCSVEIEGELVVHVAERFLDPATILDDEAYPIEGDQVDLAPLVHDAVFLDLPIAPLCRPDCKGLCATCGADLNEGPCHCPPAADPRWATLDALRSPEPTGEPPATSP